MHFDNFPNKEEINGLVDYIIVQRPSSLYIYSKGGNLPLVNSMLSLI